MKLLGKSIGRNLQYIGFGNHLLDMIPKTQGTKVQINKWDYIKLNFCASKKAINRVKRQLTEWEKAFTNHISDKKSICRIYKRNPIS